MIIERRRRRLRSMMKMTIVIEKFFDDQFVWMHSDALMMTMILVRRNMD